MARFNGSVEEALPMSETTQTMFVVFAVLAASACGPLAPTGGNEADTGTGSAPAAAETDYQQRLRTMAAGQRDAVFIRALRDAGIPCQGVEASSYLGTNSGNASWTASCEDRSQWLITVGSSGVAQIMSLSDAKRTLQKGGLRP